MLYIPEVIGVMRVFVFWVYFVATGVLLYITFLSLVVEDPSIKAVLVARKVCGIAAAAKMLIYKISSM